MILEIGLKETRMFGFFKKKIVFKLDKFTSKQMAHKSIFFKVDILPEGKKKKVKSDIVVSQLLFCVFCNLDYLNDYN